MTLCLHSQNAYFLTFVSWFRLSSSRADSALFSMSEVIISQGGCILTTGSLSSRVPWWRSSSVFGRRSDRQTERKRSCWSDSRVPQNGPVLFQTNTTCFTFGADLEEPRRNPSPSGSARMEFSILVQTGHKTCKHAKL